MIGKEGSSLLLSIFFVLLILPQPLILGQESVTIEGVVREHSTGNPIPRAKILALWRDWRGGWKKMFHGEVDSDGYFHLELPWGENIIYAYYDDPLTLGFDYVPSMRHITTPSNGRLNITFELWDGASIFLEGEAFFVETTETPQSSYSVIDPNSGEIIRQDEYSFYYGEDSPHYQIPGVSPKHIIIPADIPFMVKVDSDIKVEEKWLRCGFLIDKPGHFVLGKGENLRIDLREYTLPASLGVVKAEASEIESMINETEEEGFYLTVERQRFNQITSLILEAENYFSQGAYETSFTRLRGAYVEISNLRDWLNSMHSEALTSVFILVAFLVFTAATTSHLLFEEKIQKIGGTSAFCVLFLMALYLLYPGSRLVKASLFLGASLLLLLTVLSLSTWVPSVLKGREVRGRVPLRNMVVPIFSIAKRSLRRRKLRFVLTLTSVMILVSSFIALTSFATGFGLTFNKVSSQMGYSSGVLVRALKTLTSPGSTHLPDEIGAEPWDVLWYPQLDNSSIGWFEDRPDTILVAPKMESLPMKVPLGSVGWVPIYGIMGIVPSAEAQILGLDKLIVEGRYLGDEDEDGVLISAKLGKRLNATVGESLILQVLGKTLNLKIIGIFNDTRFEELRDLDGQSPLPWKLEAHTIPKTHGSITNWELTHCSADETLVVTWKTASEIDGMFLSRLDIVCEEGKDLEEYAKMMALNKGFRAWASTEDGVYLAQLASYFEGKGLPIAVPWGIVVLNVIVTMLSALYERKREIYIYSAIGMNPSHISGLFLVEAAMIGVLGGGIGYLLGLGWYKAMSLLALGLQVKQKVSAIWVLAAIAVSMAAVLTGGFAALKGSVVITPSLKREWKIEASTIEPLELTLPVRVTEAETEEFIGYIMDKLRSHMDDLDYVTSGIRESRKKLEEASIRTIEFTYRHADPLTTIYSKNKVILKKEGGSEVYTVKFMTQGDPKGIHKAASIVRKIIMEWSVERGKL